LHYSAEMLVACISRNISCQPQRQTIFTFQDSLCTWKPAENHSYKDSAQAQPL